MTDAIRAAEAFREAAHLNREDPLLDGSLLRFPDYGQLVMTGDLHGHRRNFERLVSFCNLENAGARHVILHELIHEEIVGLDTSDTSHELLFAAARWKCEFPDQVHFVLSNHELSQLNHDEITKNGRVVTEHFEKSVREAFGMGGDNVLDAISELIRSFPLAGRTASRVFLSHSLPAPRVLPAFDPSVLTRVPTDEDLHEPGSAHSLVWGRYHTEGALEALCDMLDVDFFVCGHQPQESGFEVVHDRMVIIASDHNHGVYIPLDLKSEMTLKKLTASIRPFAALV